MKSPDAFRTISEVATDLDVPQHVLRFWETKFSQIRPMKRGGGRRYYRREDLELLRGIKHLLYTDGYTIKGVQKVLRESGVRTVMEIGRAGEVELPDEAAQGYAASSAPVPGTDHGLSPAARERLEAVIAELEAIRDLLKDQGRGSR